MAVRFVNRDTKVQQRRRAILSESKVERQQWRARYEIHRYELCDEKVAAQADSLIGALAEFRRTRTSTQGWIGAEWTQALRSRQWSLLVRLRDSIATRAAVAEAAALPITSPQLQQSVAARVAELSALDADVDEEAQQLENLIDLATAIDAADEQRRQAEDVLRRLDGPKEDVDTPRESDTDPAILIAGLDAVLDHVRKGTPETTV